MEPDRQLRSSVQAELDWEPSIDASAVGVAVQGGVVTLTGHLRTYAEKAAIERVVGRVKGVRAVAVDLDVRLPAELVRDDTEIAQAVDRALSWNACVPQGQVRVRVERGWVTLSGTVDWDYQRQMAAELVRPLHGVRGVSNQVALTERPLPVDLQIRIHSALQRHARQEAHDITASVDGSTVTLRGHVDSWVDRHAAQEAAWAAPGVRKVVNEIRLVP